MIKANELRVANLVYYKDKICPIESIERSGYVEVGTDIGGWVECCDVEDIEAIPLTVEILEGAGFEKNRDNEFIISMALDFHLSISFYPDGAFPILIKDSEMYNGEAQMVPLNRLDYLHQLQNLYFALTGEELTLDLCTNA
jgi:hypothetical protein